MPLIAAVLLSALASAAQPSSPGSTWIAWNTRLEPVVGQLVSISAESVRLRDERGRVVDLPRGDVLALMIDREPVDPTQAVSPASGNDGRFGVVSLVDGQRWRASVLPDAREGDVSLLVAGVGRVQIPLDVLAGINFDDASAGPAGSVDRVRLANADIIEGTVLEIAAQVEIEADTEVRAPLGSVASVELVNPPIPPAPMRLWLSDGSVFAAQALIGDDLGSLRSEAIAPALDGWKAFGQVRAIDAAFARTLRGIEFAPRRLVPLASLELLTYVPEGERRWTPPPLVHPPGLLGLSDVELSGPMLVEWCLPRGGQRVAGTAALVHSESPWADCVVRIEQNGRVLWEQQLNADAPSAGFVVELENDAKVGVRILPGERGPVHDAVRLELGWVLLEAPGESG